MLFTGRIHSLYYLCDERGLELGVVANDGRVSTCAKRKEQKPVEPKSPKLPNTLEIAVLERLVQGESNQKIGEALGISESAVKLRLNSAGKKLGSGNRVLIAVIALRRGLVT